MASQRPESPEADDQEETQVKRSIDTPASPEIAATELLKAAGPSTYAEPPRAARP